MPRLLVLVQLIMLFASSRGLTLLGHDITHLRVVLASASPRRRELLALTGLREGVHFEVSPSTFAEDLAKSDFAITPDSSCNLAPYCESARTYRSLKFGHRDTV